MQHPPIKHLFIITGTTRGIGKALAAAAMRWPDSFTISLSRAGPFLKDNRQNIRIDLSDAGAIGPAFRRIDIQGRAAGALTHTVLINNAGVLDPIGPIGACDDSLLAGNIQVNLTAPLILCRHFFRFSQAFPGRKWIVSITSGAARTPYFGWSAYGAAKAGLEMASRCMALEFSAIDPAFYACTVAPGTVDTAMQAKIRGCTPGQFARVDKFLKLKAGGKLDSPEAVASRLIRLLMDGRFENGGRYDLRKIEE